MSDSSIAFPENVMEKLVSLCKQRGFVFQSSEIYGGLKSCYDYGPLGVELKRNIKNEWWRTMVHGRQDIVGIDASIIMKPDVWKASGHLSGFCDPVVDCKLSKERFRADQALERSELKEGEYELVIEAEDKGKAKAWLEALPKIDPTGAFFRRSGKTLKAEVKVEHLSKESRTAQMQVKDPETGEYSDWVSVQTYSAPGCGNPYLSDERQFNLMFRASLGPVDPIQNIQAALENAGPEVLQDKQKLRDVLSGAVEKTAVYLRPETAQAMFVNFANVQSTSRLKPPFGIAQQGKSFRNEITVEHFIFRSCEFEQMEMEYFVPPEEYTDDGKTPMDWLEYWYNTRLQWYKEIGIRAERLKLRQHEKDELAHYAGDCYDVEYLYPWGWGELEGIAYRKNYDLTCHQEASKKKLTYFDPQKNAHYLPHVIEPAAGADRTALACLIDAYEEEPAREGKKEGRTVLRLHPRIAPIKAAVFPLVKKDGMPEIARKIVDELSKNHINAFYDEKDAVGRRYRRQDECGTPYCLTVDGETASDGTVTIRERDSMSQERIKVEDAVEVIRKRLDQ